MNETNADQDFFRFMFIFHLEDIMYELETTLFSYKISKWKLIFLFLSFLQYTQVLLS